MEANMCGTEILEPLEHVLKFDPIEGHARNVFLLTDGDVENQDQVFRLVRKYTHNTGTRIFTLGIGEDVSTALIKGIASRGGGHADFVTETDTLKSKVVNLLKCAMQPVIKDVTVTFDLPSDVTYITVPTELPSSLLPGERFTVYAILQGFDKNQRPVESFVSLEGQKTGTPVSYRMTFTLGQDNDKCTSAPIHRLATKAQIKMLEGVIATDLIYRMYIEAEETLQKIINISRQGNILSKYTAFVAIDIKGKQVEKKSQTRSCPVPIVTINYLDGLYDADLMKKGVTDPSTFAAAERARSVQCMKLTKRHIRLLEEDEKAVKGGCESQSGFSFGWSGRKPFNFHIKLPKLKGLFTKWRKRKTYKVEKSHGKNQPSATNNKEGAGACSNICEVEVPVCSTSTESTTTDNKLFDDVMVSVTDDVLMAVIELQQLQGQWKVSDTLLQFLDVDVVAVSSIKCISEPSVVCTVVVISWLRRHYPHRKNEWQMIEIKALKWLESQNLPSSTDDIIMKVTQELWPDEKFDDL